MNVSGSSIKLFAGNASKDLAEGISKHLFMELGGLEASKFSDGEISIFVKETVRGRDVFIVQSTSQPANDNLMELLIEIDAMKRASAGRITAVIPYFGYARQDRKARPRDAITAKLVADLLQSAGADRVLTMDLHAPQIQGFFDIPLDHLFGSPIFVKHFKKKFAQLTVDGKDELVVVSPDVGSVSRARSIAQKINARLAIVDKRRPKANAIEIMNVIGDVTGKTCLMVDDMIDTAGTICQGAEALMKNGAKEVYVCCTHAVLSGPAIDRLQAAPIKEVVFLDTIDVPKEKMIAKFTKISVAPTFAEAIRRIYEDKPISTLYE